MATMDDILGGNASADDKKTPVPVETGNEYGRNETEFRKYNPDPLPTPEEDEKLRKKRKRDEIFAAIGDGISALSNLYFTTQYAPNMYDPKNSMSERTRIRYDKLLQDREKKKSAYYEGMLKARQADNAERAQKWQEWLDNKRLELYQAAEARNSEMHDLNMQLKNHQIDEAEYKAKVAEIEAKYAPQLEESKIERNKAAAGASKAAASASTARAGYYANGGSSGNRYYGEFRGKKYTTKADYEKAVLDGAREKGVDIYDLDNSNPFESKRVKRSIAAIAAEVSEKDKKETGSLGWGKKDNETDW